MGEAGGKGRWRRRLFRPHSYITSLLLKCTKSFISFIFTSIFVHRCPVAAAAGVEADGRHACTVVSNKWKVAKVRWAAATRPSPSLSCLYLLTEELITSLAVDAHVGRADGRNGKGCHSYHHAMLLLDGRTPPYPSIFLRDIIVSCP